jgi:hypothetical protein
MATVTFFHAVMMMKTIRSNYSSFYLSYNGCHKCYL